jgi:hypothetical protein
VERTDGEEEDEVQYVDVAFSFCVKLGYGIMVHLLRTMSA